ncbi:MAG TPA: 30S ribosomal protein S3 [Clostridiales bacterium]|nr:30S ribosomal protein S3 [Clostridiales bacterium]
MGQKVNPHGLRVGIIRDWDSRWYVKDAEFGDTLVSDYKVRRFLKEQLHSAGVPKFEIERDPQRVRVFIHCAKPGMVIGRGGAEIEKLKATLEGMVGKPVSVNVYEIKSPDLNAQLVAESIASQIERRVSFRRAMKQAISRTMRLGAKGIKVMVSGRLNGAEIARSEHYHEGTIPLQTLRADIDYGFWEASTTYGKIGVKVWIYKGEVLQDTGKKRRFVETMPQQQKQSGRGGRRGSGRGGYQGGSARAGGRAGGSPKGRGRTGGQGGRNQAADRGNAPAPQTKDNPQKGGDA